MRNSVRLIANITYSKRQVIRKVIHFVLMIFLSVFIVTFVMDPFYNYHLSMGNIKNEKWDVIISNCSVPQFDMKLENENLKSKIAFNTLVEVDLSYGEKTIDKILIGRLLDDSFDELFNMVLTGLVDYDKSLF